MIRFPHLSFDLWLTLIKSNPEFKAKKIELLHSNYNPQSKDINEVKSILRRVDVNCTRLAEITGRNVNPLDMWGIILFEMGYDEDLHLSIDVIEELHKKVQDIYLMYLPLPFSEDTIDNLKFLYDKVAIMTIASNTGFIPGVTVRKALEELNMLQYFKEAIFSDECGYAKPSPLFFNEVKKISPFSRELILHIGDNFNADIFGAQSSGIVAFQINSCKDSIADIYKFITE